MDEKEKTTTMVRTQVVVNDAGFYLAQGQDLEKLKEEIEDAAKSGGKFVDFVIVGNRVASVLITFGTQVVMSVETVQFDPRDTGDDTDPFGGAFDML